MKKTFNLLIITTITFGTIPNLIANKPYNYGLSEFDTTKNKNLSFKTHYSIKKRNTPKSLLTQLTTINIGKIRKNDKKHIIERLETTNHPIFSLENFLENFVIDNITFNQATGHLREAIRVGEKINDIIPETLSFTINFTADNFTLNTFIPQQNLENLENNSDYAILERLQQINPLILMSNLHLRILNVTQTSAIIDTVNGFEHNIESTPIEVHFSTNNFTLGSLNPQCFLGELPNNEIETIKSAFLSANPTIKESAISEITLIEPTQAIITGTLATPTDVPIALFSDHSWLPNADNVHNYPYYGTQTAYRPWNYRNSIHVYFTLPVKKLNENKNLPKEQGFFDKFKNWLFGKDNSNPDITNKWTSFITDLPPNYLNSDLDNILECDCLSKEKKVTVLNKLKQQFELTTIDIGNIALNDKAHIFEQTNLLNHPIFSDPNFKQNFIFDEITANSAKGHLFKNIFKNEKCLYDFINETTSFTINFTTNNYSLSPVLKHEQVLEKKIMSDLKNFENLLISIIKKANLTPDLNLLLITLELNNKFPSFDNGQKDKIIKNYNLISKELKQQKLNEINEKMKTWSVEQQKTFKENVKALGTTAYNDGINIDLSKTIVTPNLPKKIENNAKDPSVIASTIISGGGLLGVSKMTGVSPIQSLKAVGNALKNSLSASRSSATVTEAVELTPLLSTSTTEGLTVAETLTTAETITEGAVLEAEAATSATLAPETLGLSLLIGGLIFVGTGLFYWISGANQTMAIQHESHNQYDEIEKYYKFLAHDKLKLSIDSFKWKTISQIYQEYSNNYQAFSNKIKTEIMSFHKEDHSGWGGKLNDNDINVLIKVLFDNFHIINKSFVTNSMHGWKIVTNTIGSYFQLEIE